MKKQITLIFSLLLSVLFASAQDIQLYVSPSGDDSAEGTAEQPLQSIGHALELVGDNSTAHIFMASGMYIEYQTLDLHSNLVIEGGLNESTWLPDSNGTTEIFINTVEFVGDYSQKIGFRSDNDTNWTLRRLNITVASATASDRASSGKGATVYVIHISGSATGNEIVDCSLVATPVYSRCCPCRSLAGRCGGGDGSR